MAGAERRARSFVTRLIIAILAALVAAPAADAHESRPLFIDIAEGAGGAVSVRAVTPASVEGANLPAVALGAPCTLAAERRRALRTMEAEYQCQALAGVTLSIDWPAFNPSVTTLVRATFASGETQTAILPPDQASWVLPQARSFNGVAQSYFVIGVEHIVFGADHLLFLGGLLLIAGTFRRAVVTATGFTLAHSLTLALVALDVIAVPAAAVEATIALSIVFLAAEIARGNRGTLAWRRPAFIASAFGLVHGAGFAAALSEIGLPQTEKTAALLFFNLGVEAGQVAIILLAFGALWPARRLLRLPANWRERRLSLAFAYPLGIVAAFWFVERAAAIFAA